MTFELRRMSVMRFNDKIVGLALMLFGAWVLFLTRDFPTLGDGIPGPSLFPRILASLFILAGAVIFFHGVKARRTLLSIDPDIGGRGLVNVGLVLATIGAYIFLSEYLGFLITSGGLLFFLMVWLKVKVPAALFMSAGVTLAVYVLFRKFLLVPLPWGLIGW